MSHEENLGVQRTSGAASESRQPPLRFGIMCAGDELQYWQSLCVRQLLDTGVAQLALLIVEADAVQPNHWFHKIRNTLASRSALWMAFQKLYPWPSLACNRPVDMRRIFARVPRIVCKTVEKRGQFFRPEEVSEIQRLNLDFILRFAFGIIRGDILESARYGIWSFHHGDERKYRGSPPGFWEVYKGDPVTGAILQRLTPRLDAGVVLQRITVQTEICSWRTTVNRVFMASVGMPAKAATELAAAPSRLSAAQPSATAAPVYRAPKDHQVAGYLMRVSCRWVLRQVRGIFQAESWNVGVVRAPVHSFLLSHPLPEVQWLVPCGRHRFLADAFGMQTERGLRIVMEQFDYVLNRGQLVSAEWRDGALAGPLRTVAGNGSHMAYPYLFTHQGTTFCLPESWHDNNLRLYRFSASEDDWMEAGILIPGIAAVDPTVIQYDGRWWLFCTDRKETSDLKLHIWYADELFGVWQPHRGNPVKVDICSSRPAGTPFLYDSVLYRPAQDCSRSYGGGITINRVIQLTPDRFEEEVAAHVAPPDAKFPDGIHTLAAAGEYTLVDGKRMVFAPAVAARRLRHKLGRLTNRFGGAVTPN